MFAEAGFRVEDAITYYRLFDAAYDLRNRPAKYLAHGPWREFSPTSSCIACVRCDPAQPRRAPIPDPYPRLR
jgi:hypothetical protein